MSIKLIKIGNVKWILNPSILSKFNLLLTTIATIRIIKYNPKIANPKYEIVPTNRISNSLININDLKKYVFNKSKEFFHFLIKYIV